MTKKFDNFLLGLLWLMTVTLATTFWINIKYGFNIFSGAHWQYLSELQAYRTNIRIDFYISLIAAIIIGLTGLYLLVRPQKNTFFIEPSQMPPRPDEYETPPQQIIHEQAPAEPAKPQQSSVEPSRPMGPSGMRPAPIARTMPRVNTPVRVPTPKPAPIPAPDPQHMDEIKNIFANNGYVIKPCDRIAKLNKPVVALSYDQHIWIGIENVSQADATDAMQALVNIFEDTLGDTANDLEVHICIVGLSEQSTNPDMISTFDTLDNFQEFMAAHPNTKPADYDEELFDAISTYIGTVISYIGKQ